MDLDPKVAALLDAQRVGSVATVSPDGRPRQSVVYFARDGARILISTERDRLKAKDAERTGWASLCVRGDEPPFPSATVAGPAAILTRDIGEGTARVMQRIAGSDEPPDPQTDEALAAVGRVLLVIDVESTGPTSYLGEEGA